jgi:HSP20 family protein
MNLVRFDPYREFAMLQDRLSRSFGSTFGRGDREDESLAAWAPPVDIAEEKDRILITAELPGFKPDEISIQTENGMLTLSGERRFEKETSDKAFHRVERSYGRFVRSFSLPNNVDREKIEARFVDGLLQIELSKREDAKPKTIKIAGGTSPETIDVKGREKVDVRSK